MWMERDEKILISMPGVPYEMKHLMQGALFDSLIDRIKGVPYAAKTIMTIGEGESRLAEKIADIEEALPKFMSLAYLPSLGSVRIRVSGKHEEETTVRNKVAEISQQIVDRLGELVYGFDEQSISQHVQELLQERSMSIAFAESCTGGNLSADIVANAGSSAIFKGAIVAYDNEVKVESLRVKSETLEEFGAVSEETVKQMAQNVRQLLNADIGVSTSGIAGPSGGSKEKPVGTIFLALAHENGCIVRKLQLSKQRKQNIAYTVKFALNMIRRHLINAQR